MRKALESINFRMASFMSNYANELKEKRELLIEEMAALPEKYVKNPKKDFLRSRNLDRGYEGYNNLAHIERKGWNYLIRIKDVDSKG